MTAHKVVAHAEWVVARKKHLAKEKEFTRLRDQLSRERRDLPRELVEKEYVFEGRDGQHTLGEILSRSFSRRQRERSRLHRSCRRVPCTVGRNRRGTTGAHISSRRPPRLDTGFYLRVCSSGGGTRTHNLRINSLIQPVARAWPIKRKVPLTSSHADRH
jgi:hypothetical protein